MSHTETINQKLIAPGKWFTEHDENGTPVKAVYDVSYREALGYESEEEYADAQNKWSSRIHPDDAERVERHFLDVISNHPEGMDYDIEYRIMTKWGYRWFHDYGRCTRRKDGSLLHCDGAIFDIQGIKDYEQDQAHDRLMREVLDYIVNHDNDDPIDLLSQFAEKIRVVLDCDQVIYRDLEKTRIMVNSPAIEKTWSVPFEYCQQCAHLDPHHPMYAGGYTEMDNCQKGWQGVPVFHKCPIKSSLTRIVYCNGEVAGYLAIHYVQKYHNFTDLERKTVEEFSRNLTLSLSRYEANKKLQDAQAHTIESMRRKEKALLHSEFRASALAYLSEHEGNITSFLDYFAEKLRDLVGCDQVIYKDEDGTRYIKNAPELGNEYEIAEQTCLNCPHSDMHSPLYAKGVTEMEDTAIGVDGVPVHKSCPVKSALTRTVRLDGKVCGYLAIHYILGHHKFSDYERQTLDEFSNLLSMSLSRNAARVRNARLEDELERKRLAEYELLSQNYARLFALEDDFESLYEVDMDSGNYISFVKGDFYQSNVIDKLLEPGDYFEDLRANIDSVIYPEDRDALFDVLNRGAIRNALSENERFEHYYRILVGDKPVWFKIRVVYKDAEKKSVVIGVFNAEQEVALKQKDEQRRQILINQMAGDDGVFIIDIEKNKRIVLHDRIHAKSGFSDERTYSKTMTNYVNSYVFDVDREMMREAMSVDYMQKRLKNQNDYTVRFRDILTGKPRYFDMKVVKLSDTEILQSFKDCDEEVLYRLLSSRLLSEYFAIYVINLNDNTWKFHKRPDTYDQNYPLGGDYRSSLGKFIEKEVHPEDRAALAILLKPKELISRFSDQPSFNMTFRTISDDSTRYLRCEVLYSSDKVHISLAFRDITEEFEEQSRRQKEAEETKKLIESIATAYNVAYVVNTKDDSFRLLKIDEGLPTAGEDCTKFSQVREFFLSNVCHPSERKHMADVLDYGNIRRKLADSKSFDVEYRAIINGVTVWHLLNVTVIDNEEVAVGFVQKDIEITKLHLEEKRYDEYFALFVVDFDTNMMKVVKNTQWYDALQIGHSYPYTPMIRDMAKSFQGMQKDFLLQLSDLEFVRQKLFKEDKITFIYYSSRVEGGRWVELTSYVTARKEDGSPAEFTLGFGVMDAMSADRQEMNRKIAEQEKKLKEALSMAKIANEAKSTFLFNMSHDIRTPLNAITGFTTMAKKYAGDKDTVLNYLSKIDVSGQQLLMLINQVLEMARIESGKIEFNENPVNIKERFETMVAVLSEQAKAKGLELNHKLIDMVHFNVYADESRMSQVTLNLVGNAMKFTPEGGRIDFILKEIPSRKKGWVTYVFTVADTGIGMSEEYLKALYEPFSRENTSTVSKIQGTGLGMTIVKNLIDLAGGKIEVKSKLGEGTRFDVTMDFRINDQIDAVEAEKVEEKNLSFKFSGKRALLVEDNEMNREIAKFILESKEVAIEEAEDGDIAVNAIKAKAAEGDFSHFDFILMDVQMPRMNGYEATRRIREILEPYGVHIPIIALSANAFEEDRQKSLEAGMDDHIAKPIEIDKLWESLAKFL